jgi:hypothetical protein
MKETKYMCIPRVQSHLSIDYISNKLQEFKIGNILSIKEIPLKNDNEFKRMIIHLTWDKTNEKIHQLDEIIQKNGSIKLVYDMPWYWKMVEKKQF